MARTADQAPIPALSGGGAMGVLARSVDWAATPLGSPMRWSPTLRQAVALCLRSRWPIILFWGPAFVQVYNDAYRPILGAKHPVAMGQRGRECWPEIWSTIGPLLEGVLRTGEATLDEDLLLLIDRGDSVEETYFRFSCSPVPDAAGVVEGVFAAVSETTGRVLGERRLRALRELGARTAGASDVDEALSLAAEALGAAVDDVPLLRLYRGDGGPGGLRPVAALTAGRVEPAETAEPAAAWSLTGAMPGASWLVPVPGPLGRRAARHGHPVRRALVVPLHGAAGVDARPLGALVAGLNPVRVYDDPQYQGFLRQLGDQLAATLAAAAAHAAERARAQALAELDAAKTTFFSNVSHEFRTPLTLMLGPLAEAAAAQRPLAAEDAALAHRSGLRLLRLVNTLLDVARIEAGRAVAAYEATDLAEVTAELASTFRSAIEAAGLTLTVDCPPLPEPIWVDREMWEKIVLNLLSNAVKFTLAGEIAVRLAACGDQVELTVRDTGIGVPAHELPRLFERFHRVPGAGGRTHEGTGIGLALVAELVRLNDGEIVAESVEGAGTTLRVRVPAGRAHLPADGPPVRLRPPSTAIEAAPFVAEALRWLPGEDEGAGAARAAAELPLSASGGAERPRLLVADDNADMREYLARVLGDRYALTLVADGEAALVAARADPPDLVLADAMMPGRDGLELVRALRADEAVHDLPVVLLSARAGEEEAAEGLAAGADDYLVKPFSERELLSRVDARLALARARRDAQATLAASEAQFRMLADSAPMMAWITDADGGATFHNRGWLEYTGRSREQESGDGWMDGIHPDDESAIRKTYASAFAAREPVELEYRLRRTDGAYGWVLGRGVPRHGPDGAFEGFVGVALDVTERRRAAERRELVARAADELEALLGDAERGEALVRLCVPGVADLAVLDLVDATGALRRTHVAHRDPEGEAVLRRLGPPVSDSVLGQAREGGGARLIALTPELLAASSATPGDRRLRAELDPRSAIVLPLRARGHLTGVLTVAVGAGRPPLDEHDRVTVEQLGERAALLLDNARLYVTELTARRDAERAVDRVERLQRVTAALGRAAGEADVARVVVREGRLALRALASAMARPEGEGEGVRVVASDGPPPAAYRNGPLAPDAGASLRLTLRTGRPLWRESSDGGEGVEVVLPLVIGGEVAAALGFRFTERERRFRYDERELVLALARLGAQALERARLYDTERLVAATLQERLLPERLPAVAGVELAARYRASNLPGEVGGDWYEAIALPEGRVALSVGDVVGRGPAAAAVMGQLRAALHAFAQVSSGPGAALAALSRFAGGIRGAVATTAALCVLDPVRGELSYACAGHPPPALVRAGALATYLWDGRAPPLGVRGDAAAGAEGRARLEPGDALLLYTDGLVERRGEHLDAGLERLARVAGTAFPSPAALLTGVLAGAVDPADVPDDVALLAARLTPAPLRLRVPARPDSLARVRRALEAWLAGIGASAEEVMDLMLATGEAVANAVEHAYPPGEAGWVEILLEPGEDGALAAQVADRGRWRERPAPGDRGRGLALMRQLVERVELTRAPEGTRVCLATRLAGGAPPTSPEAAAARVAPAPAEVIVERGPGAAVVRLRGEVDHASAAAVAARLDDPALAQVAPLLDLTGVRFLDSAGVLVLTRLVERHAPARLELVPPPAGGVRRVLELTGLLALVHVREPGPAGPG